MAQYKPNSDSFNQLLLKLDEHGARANFIDEFLRRARAVSFDYMNSVRVEGSVPPHDVLMFAFTWSETTDGHYYWSDIHKKVGGAYV